MSRPANPLILVEDLIRVLQYRIHRADLPGGVGDVASGRRAHERRPEHDGQVLRVHAVHGAVLHDPPQVQRQRAQRGVVGVRQAVDDGVHAVPAHDVVVLPSRLDEGPVILRREDRVREVAEELLQQTGNAIDVVEEVLGVAEVQDVSFLICTDNSKLVSWLSRKKEVGR